MDAMLALLPEDEKPGCLFQGLFLERLPVKMRDHLVSREFKHPSEMALYVVEHRTVEAHHQTTVVKPQVHQTLSVISTNVLVLQPTIVALLAVSRETPEPMGGGKIKQPSRRQLSCIPSRCPVKPWFKNLMDPGVLAVITTV